MSYTFLSTNILTCVFTELKNRPFIFSKLKINVTINLDVANFFQILVVFNTFIHSVNRIVFSEVLENKTKI